MKLGSPPTSFNLPFIAYRHENASGEWTATALTFKITSNELYFGANSSGVSNTILPNKWFWFEARVYCHTSSGIAELRVNLTNTKRWTGIATVTTAGTSPPTGEIDVQCSKFRYSDFYLTTYECMFDNMYVMLADSEGELDWLGEAVCEHIVPMGVGAETNGTPTGATNYGSVSFPINDIIYVEAGVGDRDCYSFSNIETDRVRTVHGVKATTRARKSNTGTATIRCYCRIGGTNYYGDTHYLSSEWREYVHIWDINPDTSLAWTSSDVNAAQFGWERVA